MNEVEEFIQRRFSIDCNWTTGNCYYFALILKDRFPKGKIYYNVVLGHFVVKIGKYFYDWTGKSSRETKKEYYIPWNKMEEYDINVKNRIIRDCIL